MNLLEAVLYITVAWLLLEAQNYRFLTALDEPQETAQPATGRLLWRRWRKPSSASSSSPTRPY